MFPDSEIARRFSCGGEKTAYLTVFGLAEYFKRSLLDKGDYCVLFDESLNNMVNKDEMKALDSDLNNALHSLK